MVTRIRKFLFHNTSTKQTIAKNTLWLFVGNIGGKLIKAALIIYAARVLGADGYGVFAYALSLAALFTTFIDFGINAIITRESTRDLSLQQKYFSTAFVIKLVMLLIVTAIIFFLAPFFIKQKEVVALLPIVVFMVGLDGFRDFGAALSRAWEKMEIEGIVQLITNAFLLIAGFIALYIARTPESLAYGYLIGVGIGTLAAFYPYRHYFKHIRATFSKSLIKKIIVTSWPFGMLGLMGVIMLNTDTIMVGWFGSIADVGYYGAAQRIIQLIYLTPGLIAAAFFPSMARLIADKERFRAILEKSLSIMTLIAVPLTVGGVLLSRDIIHLLYGVAYDPATEAFRILNLTYLPMFLSYMFGNAVFSLNKEKKLIAYVLLGTIGNFLFDLLFIPLWGIAGASLSTLFNLAIITLYLIWVLREETHFKILHQIQKITLATLVMGAVVVGSKFAGLNLYGIITLGTLTYFVSLYLVKEEALTEMGNIIKSRSPHR
ncbi:MAG: flippase [Candidatus Paceibacterota bacterium]|jgi:O-antigen/teichoic acid export membrane protein